MEALTKKQKHFLQSLANTLKPTITIGKNGLTENTLVSVRNAFNTKELLKIKLLDNCPDDPKSIAETIAKETGSTLVQIIGRTLLYYHQNREKPKIVLPESDIE